MINLEEIRLTVIKSIKDYLKIPVVRTNQNAEPPTFPYISYTITTLMKTNNGTYSEYIENKDGENKKIYRKEFQQVWSFTAHSNDDLQSKELAINLYDYLDKKGTIYFSDNEIVIQRIENITNRDNLLSIDYEYKNGFDVTFSFMNEIEGTTTEEIDKFTINNATKE